MISLHNFTAKYVSEMANIELVTEGPMVNLICSPILHYFILELDLGLRLRLWF